jgi:hypothetical protein
MTVSVLKVNATAFKGVREQLRSHGLRKPGHVFHDAGPVDMFFNCDETHRVLFPGKFGSPAWRSIRSKGRRQAGEKSSPDTGDSRDLGTAEANAA